MFQLSYGSYEHSPGEATIRISKQVLNTEGGVAYGIRETWHIHGKMLAASTVLLEGFLNDLETAYAVNNQDLVLYDNLGNAARTLAGLTPLGGTRVLSFDFPEDGRAGSEFVLYRTYEIVVEGLYQPQGQEDGLLSWTETLQFSGGGPKFIFLQPINGLPVRQQVAENTPYRAVQKGRAVGLYSYPSPPGPIWPADEHQDQRDTSPEDPKRSGGREAPVYTEFPVSWTYVFESAAPLVASSPTLYP